MDTKIIASGNVPGWAYHIGPGRCSFCGTTTAPVLTVLEQGACEICSSLASHVWRQLESHGLPASSLPGFSVGRASVRIVVVREDDNPTKPLEILVVGNKFNTPSHRCLPGGKVEPGEDPQQAACRELLEETGLASWPQAMEPLCSGFTLRGRESSTFLCRAFTGEASSREGLPVHWTTVPIAHLTSEYAAFYRGVDTSLATRARLKRAAHPGTPLSVHLSEAAAEFVRRRLERRARGLAGGDKIMDGLMSVLSEEERGAVELVCGLRFGVMEVRGTDAEAGKSGGEEPVFDDTEGSFEP